MGLLGGIAGLFGANSQAGDLKNLAKNNQKAVGAANTANKQFADQLLAMSHPDMSGADLGNLLFSQGENEAQRQHDIDLATTLRQNLRSGSPSSAADIIGGFDRQNANQWADRRTSATLQGLEGVLPSSAAIQTAGNLGKVIPATLDPQVMAASIGMKDSALPNFLNAIDPSSLLSGLFGQSQQPQNPTLGNSNAPVQPQQGQPSMLAQLLPYLLG